MRIGILFGGPSREREISFAGGRTVYDNLDKNLFEPVPIFIDSLKNFILLDWQHLYKGTIRDFYPPAEFVPKSQHGFQVYIESLGALPDEQLDRLIAKVGKPIHLDDLPKLIDVAFLALHGEYGEDGQIQNQLEELGIPYTGSGEEASAIGMNKALQKKVMQEAGWPMPKFQIITREQWATRAPSPWGEGRGEAAPSPWGEGWGEAIIVKPANQGSSIGASRVDSPEELQAALDRAFFARKITATEWKDYTEPERIAFVRDLADIREGIGLPVTVNGSTIRHPDELFDAVDEILKNSDSIVIESASQETEVVIEEFIEGKEFSCIVIRNENADGSLGEPVALPPTEIRKGGEVFDYRSKYLAGLSRKVTPIDLPDEQINAIRRECEKLFDFFGFHVYARIDGFIKADGTIYLNDPNTTSGMLPSSFFFHQAAEIGLNPSQFLTYIIRTSLAERSTSANLSLRAPTSGGTKQTPLPNLSLRTQTKVGAKQSHESTGLLHSFLPRNDTLLKELDEVIETQHEVTSQRTRVAVILGGYSSERHISVESGRNIYEKLSASTKHEPMPVFLKGNADRYDLWQIPVNMLLKDNADDISEKIEHYKTHKLIEDIKTTCRVITAKYASSDYSFEPRLMDIGRLKDEADFAFIALHGRPGEDGALQRVLEEIGVPYNGSGPDSSQITIDKHRTNEMLAANGFNVPGQLIVSKSDFTGDDETIGNIEHDMGYPFIAKPVDDGCSSAVKRITNEVELDAFLKTIFRDDEQIGKTEAAKLKLKLREEFPRKDRALMERLIERGGAAHFLEVTGGMLIRPGEEPQFEVFEPSETLAGDAVLSLEEKFLAGEGQNITPARFSDDPNENARVSEQVKADLQRVASVLGVEGYCRIDAFVRIFEDGRVETIIIEVNSLPGMTPATCIFHQAAINGYKPVDFIDRIIEYGVERKKVRV